MEVVTTRDQSSDSIATSEEFEDLGNVNKNTVEMKPNGESSTAQIEVEQPSKTQKTSPEMEIGNNGNMADLRETLDEVLNEETQTSGMCHLYRQHFFTLLYYINCE